MRHSHGGERDQARSEVGQMSVARLDQVTKDFAAGKSTLLRHLNGPTGPRLHVLRSGIGMIFQSFNLAGPMSVLENMWSGRWGR